MAQTTRVLILVKTYPQPSRRYSEVVCTAGITSDGEWVRLYPIDFRYLPSEKQFQKYQWIDVELADRGAQNDNRKESRRPNLDSIELGEILDTADKWRKRRAYVDRLPVKTMNEWLRAYDVDKTSLGLIRPSSVVDVIYEEKESDDWPDDKLDLVNQLSLLNPNQMPLKPIPYKFSYSFTCSDSQGVYTRMIEDWELGTLFLKEKQRLGTNDAAAKSVREKFLTELAGPSRDTHFYVGTTWPYNTWVVLGVYWPPSQNQMDLF